MSNTGLKTVWAEPVILAIDTASPQASLTVSRAEDIIATLTVRDNRPHSQTLFSHISTLLRIAETNIEDIGAFAAATGPGSFTGLRVGLAAIKGLAESLNKPGFGVDSLDLLALASGADGAHIVMINAGREEVYCGFREIISGDIINRSIRDWVGKLAAVLDELMRYINHSMLIITGDGALKYKDEVCDFIKERNKTSAAHYDSRQMVFIKQAHNISTVLAQRAARLIKSDQASVVRAHYIRQSDAEIKWKLRQ